MYTCYKCDYTHPPLASKKRFHFYPIPTVLNFQITHHTPNKCKNHSLNECGCRDAPCKKSWKQGNPLSNTIKDTSTIMRNPLPESCREGLHVIVLVSLIVLLRGVLVSTMFCMVHPYIHIHSMNDFCTCSTYVTVYAKTRHLSKILIFEFLPAFSLCIIDTPS